MSNRALDLATERHRAGDLATARKLYRDALTQNPTELAAMFRSGLLELQDGRPEAALEFLLAAVRVAPAEPRHHFGLGQALQALKRPAEAAEAYQRVLALDPAFDDAHFALGHCLQVCGRFSEAEPIYRRALQQSPGDVRVLANLGVLLLALGRSDEAVQLQRAARAREPAVANHAINLGIALCAQGDFAAARDVLEATLAREPENSAAMFNLAIAQRGLGELPAAVQTYRRAIELRPDYADAYNNLGNLHKELGEMSLAAEAYEAAIRLRPDWVVALNNAGCLLRTIGRFDEAEGMLRRALQLSPGLAALHDNLGNVLKDSGELDAAISCFRAALELDPEAAATHSNLVYALSFQCAEPAPILAEARRWNARFAVPLATEIARHTNDRDRERRLRVGYVSADFRDHCQSLFMIPLLTHHDQARFEIVCYSSVARPDAYTERARAACAVWREVHARSDRAVADLIRADGIDILIDLTMHMAQGRPLVFARKPAPIQVAWLAYPGTTGLDAMDYRLSDPRLDPVEWAPCYSERTVYLPDSFWCYDPLCEEINVGEPPAAARGYVTFGCLNNPCKLTDATLQLWGTVLRELADARLVLLAREGRQREVLLARLQRVGIAAARVRFVPFQSRADYLRTYRDIDIGLDTLPYNGHTTSIDSFWMGVPVISRVGMTCVGRGGLSQLVQLGLPELAAHSDGDYREAVVALAKDLPRLGALRKQLRSRLQASPLMDAPRFARHIEAAYRGMWRDYCVTEAPRPATPIP